MIARLSILVVVLLFTCCSNIMASSYYVNALYGNDNNKGNSIAEAFKTIDRVNKVEIQAGDSILFATGQTFWGMLVIKNIRATVQQPIVITSYIDNNNLAFPVIDAANQLNALLIQNASNIIVQKLTFTGTLPYPKTDSTSKNAMKCGVLVTLTSNEEHENILFENINIHDVYFNSPTFTRSAAETKSANGTQSYGWGLRIMNNTQHGKLNKVKVLKTTIYNVSHTGLKATATSKGINELEIADCLVYNTGGPGMQFSGIHVGHIHHNKIHHSGSVADSRNWGRGSGLWTWGCTDILIEHNRFENANGPGDSAGVHIDYNCSNIIIQYNISANNAGGFCEILGNNFNCAYRYNISINDGFRVKGEQGAFQEGKIFWLSGYVGNQKQNAGPYNSYFYNNTIYVSKNSTPKIAVSSSASGVFIANNIFYFETNAQAVAGDQKQKELDFNQTIPNVIFKNNLYLNDSNWPKQFVINDEAPVYGNPKFKNITGLNAIDYTPHNKALIQNKGIAIQQIPADKIGLIGGLQVEKDILGNKIIGLPDLGAIEIEN